MTKASRDAAHFERLYAGGQDPWNFTTSAYERDKYAATVGMIADRRYGVGLEVGCSIGVLSRQVAPLCDAFLGIDITETPLVAARERCRDIPAARFEAMAVPDMWPAGRFDLILLSEVLYFLTAGDTRRTAAHVRRSLRPAGRVLLVNWTGRLDDPQQGDEAAEGFMAAADLAIEQQTRGERFRMDLLARPG
jgi:SAM-dependent methyltransferase